MDSGFMALSIYCVQMAPKWSCVLDSQPIQGKDMSVQVYYDQFCSWRSKLEAVNYIGDEEWYVDDFLCGLKMDLVVRVLGYKWRPRRLSDAFHRAEIEEIMLSWKENSRKNDADEVFEVMSKPVSIEKPTPLSTEQPQNLRDADPYSSVSTYNSVEAGPEVKNLLDYERESTAKQVLGGQNDSKNDAYKVLDGMTISAPAGLHLCPLNYIRQEECSFQSFNGDEVSYLTSVDNQLVFELEQLPSLKMMSLKAGHPLFDKMPKQTSVEQNNEKRRLNISHLLLFPRLDTKLWLGEILRFIFDPGGSSMYHMSCHSIQELPYVASSIWCRLRNFARNIKLNSVLDFVGYVPVEVLVVYVKMGGQDKVMHYLFYSCIYWVQDKNSEAIVVSTYVEPIDAAALVIPVIPFTRKNQFFAVLSGKSNTRIGIGAVLAHVVAAVAILGLIACVIHRHKLRVGGYGKKMEGSHWMTAGPFLMPIKTILNLSRCVHYKRKCKIRAPCCDEVFDCRHCHNEAKNSLEIDPFLRHDLPRHEVKSVICSNCGAEQDEDVSKQQYHCEECRICRTGGKENFFHYNKCGCCYSKSIKDSHHCIDRAMHHNCPVCFEFLFDSVKDITVLQCGHTMHVYCVKEMELRNRFTCPVCSKSICDLSNDQENLQHQCQSGKKRAVVSSKGILVYGRLPAHFMFMKKYFQVVTKLLF